jgi:multicomponent Na+:H+ antiporter subunit E
MSVDHLSSTNVPLSGKKPSPALSPRTKRILSFGISFLICFATWIVLSGRFDLFHLGLGVVACTIVAALSGNILISRRGLQQMPRQWFGFITYVPWLVYQVFLANLHVMYLVLHPRMIELIDPDIIHFKSRLKKPMSLFIFANSITLTPGTITVYVSINGDFTVHVIDEQSGTTLPGDMEDRVARLMGE